MTRTTDKPSTTVSAHLLTIAEAAAFLNVPQRWVSDAVRARRIRCTRIGKHVRFRPADLEELIVAGEQPVLEHPSNFAVLRHASSARSHL